MHDAISANNAIFPNLKTIKLLLSRFEDNDYMKAITLFRRHQIPRKLASNFVLSLSILSLIKKQSRYFKYNFDHFEFFSTSKWSKVTSLWWDINCGKWLAYEFTRVTMSHFWAIKNVSLWILLYVRVKYCILQNARERYIIDTFFFQK